ncbi:hypothetical protein Tco_0121988 [Tanacetum coccineum]
MYKNKNIDYVYLLWEDFLFHVENKDTKKTNKMLYPRFTKVIIDYFMSKDQSILRRNKMFWHTARDDTMFTSMRCVSRHEKTQVYGVILPQHLTNQAMLESIAYQTYYAYASIEKAPKEKLKSLAKVAKTDMKKQPAMMPKTKGLAILYGSGDGVDTQSKVPDEQQQKVSGTNEGAGVRPEVPDVPKYDSKSDEESWTFSQDEEDADEETDVNDDNDQEEENEKADDEEMSSDQRVSTPPEYELTEEEEEENKEGDDKDKEGKQEQDEEDDLYRDVNINLERSDAEMILISLKLLWDTDIPNFASLFWFKQRVSVLETEMSEFKQTNQFTEAVSSIPGIVDNYLASKMKETVDSTMKAIIKEHVQAQVSKIMPKIKKYVTESLRAEVLVRSTNQPQTSYAVVALLSEFELKKILIDKMEENKSIDRSDIQKDLYKTLVESYNSDKDIISSYGKEAESSKEPTHKESKSTSSSKGASKSQPKSSGKSAQAEEHGQKVDALEEHSHQEFNTGNDDVIPVREILEDASQWNPPSIQYSFNEFLAIPIDFSAFIMNRLKIDNLTQEVLTDPTYDLIKGTCKSVVELEYHLEEVFKATNDRLDWHNPEGKPYPHDLSKPLPLIQNERGRQVIPWNYFINNDLEYLKGESSSQNYTTSVTKAKAADYGQVKWIKNKVSRIRSPVKVVYDKHAYWGTYHWGPKHRRFYGYASNMESSYDVYSRHMIIAVTCLKIREWFGYSHLEEIIVRRQDDKLYKFREGNFKRIRRQDIEDMLLLLVQDKMSNLNLEERYALNVALRMFTRRIIIQERVEDLQLGVESYQKKINLTRADTYRSDLRRMTPYTTYPDI